MIATALVTGRPATAASPTIEVYKDPTCGCCGKWVEHLRANGFSARVNEIAALDAFKSRVGVPAALASCHTALVDGYVIEGHVPAAEIRRLLTDRPKARGLAVPGMPPGAPGMDIPRAPGYTVLLFDADGTSRNYRSYPAT
jgi:hypothetical protein